MGLKAVASPPSADSALIKKAEKRFKKFVILFWAAAALLVALSLKIPQNPDFFWNQNILWNIGSILVLFSVIHNRYFDIKKNCNPENRHFSGSQFDPVCSFFEKIALHSWILGFLLLALSRWTKF